MNDPNNVARFLMYFILYTRDFKIIISLLSGDVFTATTIDWAFTAPQGADNPWFVVVTPTPVSPLTAALNSAKLK